MVLLNIRYSSYSTVPFNSIQNNVFSIDKYYICYTRDVPSNREHRPSQPHSTHGGYLCTFNIRRIQCVPNSVGILYRFHRQTEMVTRFCFGNGNLFPFRKRKHLSISDSRNKMDTCFCTDSNGPPELILSYTWVRTYLLSSFPESNLYFLEYGNNLVNGLARFVSPSSLPTRIMPAANDSLMMW